MIEPAKRPAAFLLLIATLFLAACASDTERAARITGTAPDRFAPLVNAERSARGLTPLDHSPRLDQIAQTHADDMSARNYFTHTSPEGRTPSDRARDARYNFCFIAENIARGHPDQPAAMAAWMTSSDHRGNMLSRSATQYGIARASGNYWVLVLARPGC